MTPEKKARLRALIALPQEHSDWEFTSVLISRPLYFMLLHLIGDVGFITPNLVTVLGFFCFLGASALIAFAPSHLVGIAVLLFARLILDDLDGMLARYRGRGSNLGSYLDKITDVIGFFAFFSALGYRSMLLTGTLAYMWVAHIATFGLLTTGYVKWVVHSFAKPETPAAPKTNPFPRSPWWKVFPVLLFIKLPALNECDIFPLSMILILLGKPHWLLMVLALTQALQMTAMVVIRGLTARRLDR